LNQAYLLADDVLRQGVQGISDLITKTGLINTDFADVESTMKGQGDALMGIGLGSGENRAKDAAAGAIDNPLLEDTTIDGATRILVNIAGDETISLVEVDEVMNTIRAKADQEVNIIHGVRFDPNLGNSIRVTVIATGFQNGPSGAGRVSGSADSGKVKDFDFINYSDFEQIRERTSRQGGCLGHRNYQEDLDIPSVIRNHSYAADGGEQEIPYPADKTADGRDF
jgi:cell division protein FtsZ